jgi:hypothetical protein
MANQLKIRINAEDGNQTVSKFTVAEKGEIAIQNDAGATVNVKFDAGTPLCDNYAPQASVDIPAGTTKTFVACDGSGGLQYRFTATVSGAGAGSEVVAIDGAAQISNDSREPILDPAEECPTCPDTAPCPEVNPILDPAFWIGVLVGGIVAFGAIRLFRRK